MFHFDFTVPPNFTYLLVRFRVDLVRFDPVFVLIIDIQLMIKLIAK